MATMENALPTWVVKAAKLPLAFAQVREDPVLDLWVLDQLGPGARVFVSQKVWLEAAVSRRSGDRHAGDDHDQAFQSYENVNRFVILESSEFGLDVDTIAAWIRSKNASDSVVDTAGLVNLVTGLKSTIRFRKTAAKLESVTRIISDVTGNAAITLPTMPSAGFPRVPRWAAARSNSEC